MKEVNEKNRYKLMVILEPPSSDIELRALAANYANQFRSLGASAVSIVSRGKRNLVYVLSQSKIGYYVEMGFQSSPQILPTCEAKLKLDKNVLRYMIFNEDKG